ncbi:Na+/H+ antiporter subunit D [Rhodovibrio salinarum]|uniref:Na+/H+ antiporter subunit D n=1 Tax=Rhodovibrio salinarum TaxID=1087 RepID=A0A934V0V1_9PROT|nr:Na+/H+ antiporter subunit D [Rhodovibrio salinarum]MBK1698021.1 Na+/H+ antiporter subunit D [Rhodovibrio salinarum]
MTHWLLFWPILVPILTASLCLLFWSRPDLQRIVSLLGTGVLAAGVLALFREVWTTGIVSVQAGDWPAPFGITFVADTLSVTMASLAALIGLGVAIYSLGDIGAERENAGFHPLFQALLTGVGGAFMTGDIFNMYVWFEVMVIASFGLLTLGGEREQVDGGVKYVILNLLATTLMLIAIGLLYGVVGTLNLADLARVVPNHPDQGLLTAIAALFLLAFGMKAAVFPLYFWLPASYHTPAAAISAVFAALLTKVGVYALIRVFSLVFTASQEFAYTVLLVVGIATMLVGILGAITQDDVRRVLSFNLVSGIGFILAGVGLGTALGLAGALYYTVHHIIVMSALFMVAGVAQRIAGAPGLTNLGGLYQKHPWIAVLFFFVAMSLAGVPPLSGFWPKVILVKASLATDAYVVAAAALVTGLLTLYSMAKVWALAFWKTQPEHTVAAAGPGILETGEMSRSEQRLTLLPVAALALATLLIGLFAQPLLTLSERAADELINHQPYVTTVLGGEGA